MVNCLLLVSRKEKKMWCLSRTETFTFLIEQSVFHVCVALLLTSTKDEKCIFLSGIFDLYSLHSFSEENQFLFSPTKRNAVVERRTPEE